MNGFRQLAGLERRVCSAAEFEERSRSRIVSPAEKHRNKHRKLLLDGSKQRRFLNAPLIGRFAPVVTLLTNSHGRISAAVAFDD